MCGFNPKFFQGNSNPQVTTGNNVNQAVNGPHGHPAQGGGHHAQEAPAQNNTIVVPTGPHGVAVVNQPAAPAAPNFHV